MVEIPPAVVQRDVVKDSPRPIEVLEDPPDLALADRAESIGALGPSDVRGGGSRGRRKLPQQPVGLRARRRSGRVTRRVPGPPGPGGIVRHSIGLGATPNFLEWPSVARAIARRARSEASVKDRRVRLQLLALMDRVD